MPIADLFADLCIAGAGEALSDAIVIGGRVRHVARCRGGCGNARGGFSPLRAAFLAFSQQLFCEREREFRYLTESFRHAGCAEWQTLQKARKERNERTA